MMTLANLFNDLTAKGFTLTICSQVHHAKIDTEGISHFFGSWCGNLKGYSQGEDAFAVDAGLLAL